MNTAICWLITFSDFLESHDGAITAVATVFMAVFTWRLWVSTHRLWGESRIAGNIAKVAAEAAARSANVAEKTLVMTQQALIFPLDPKVETMWDADTLLIQYCDITLAWENAGATVALECENWFDIKFFRRDPPQDIIFGRDIEGREASKSYIGPRRKFYGSPLRITSNQMIDIIEKRTRGFVWGIVKYNDIFDKTTRHHTQMCAEVEVVYDPRVPAPRDSAPSTVLRFRAETQYNSAS